MTDIAKALAFATHCLQWEKAEVVTYATGTVVCDGFSARDFKPGSATDLERVLQEFLGKRYFIQINRGTGSLFQWRVIVGLQDPASRAPASTTHRRRVRVCGTASSTLVCRRLGYKEFGWGNLLLHRLLRIVMEQLFHPQAVPVDILLKFHFG